MSLLTLYFVLAFLCGCKEDLILSASIKKSKNGTSGFIENSALYKVLSAICGFLFRYVRQYLPLECLECSQPWHFIISFCIGKCKLLWHVLIKYILEAWVIWGQFTWQNAFWRIKKVKNCWKIWKKHIPNFSSLGLQDLYENNQIHGEFLARGLLNKLNDFVMYCLWALCELRSSLWKWKRNYEWKAGCGGGCQLHMKVDKYNGLNFICYSLDPDFHCSVCPISNLRTQYQHMSGVRENTTSSSDYYFIFESVT